MAKTAEQCKLKDELDAIGAVAKQSMEFSQKVKELQRENKKLTEENKTLGENFNTERVGCYHHVLISMPSYC